MSPRFVNGKLLLFGTNGDIVYESSVRSPQFDQEASQSEKETTSAVQSTLLLNSEYEFEETDELVSNQEVKRIMENRLKEKKENESEEQLALDALVF